MITRTEPDSLMDEDEDKVFRMRESIPKIPPRVHRDRAKSMPEKSILADWRK